MIQGLNPNMFLITVLYKVGIRQIIINKYYVKHIRFYYIAQISYRTQYAVTAVVLWVDYVDQRREREDTGYLAGQVIYGQNRSFWSIYPCANYTPERAIHQKIHYLNSNQLFAFSSLLPAKLYF